MANLGVQTMENCTISIEESPLAGDWKVESVLGEQLFEEINFAENGSITDFPVAPVLEGGQTMIFILNK